MNTLADKVTYKYENLLLVFFSAIAALSSIGLLLSELSYLKNSDEALGCDINPLVGCSSSISSWQAHLFFGVPNSLVGLCIFVALFTVFILVSLNISLYKWMWNTIFVGSTLSMVWVAWFLWVSIFTFKKLCPFCMLIWLSVIVIWIVVLGIVFRNAFITKNTFVNDLFGTYRFYLGVIILLFILVSVIFGMMDVWILVFNM